MIFNFQKSSSNRQFEMAVHNRNISADIFYGPKSAAQIRIEDILNKSTESHQQKPKSLPKFMGELLGPSRTWKVFLKQQEAIDFCVQRRNGLMIFPFEQDNGRRLFLVCHPKVFWALNSHRFFKDCSSYEIIREFEVCKLYLDIEFEYIFNSDKVTRGNKMLENLLSIINVNLDKCYGISCSSENILNLDSSNEKKFSHHIIYQISGVAFQDNYAVGNFIHKICNQIERAYNNYLAGNKDEINKISHDNKLKMEDILDLFVYDNKRNLKLIVDKGVYTKNRHFRLFGSTKLNKNSHLALCQSNKYLPNAENQRDLNIFLDSLVTYFSNDINTTLECDGPEMSKNKGRVKPDGNFTALDAFSSPAHSPIDKFISGLISPFGGIRKKSFISSCSKIIYEIFGYRYCDNIKRHHKSNNIMFIVDTQSLTYYQKCHDADCAGFKSAITKLPEEVCFQLEDDTEFFDNINEWSVMHDESGDNKEIIEKELEILSCLEDLANDSEF